MTYQVLVLDSTETPIEKPQKTTLFLFRKEKRYTIKTQIIVSTSDRKVLCTCFSNGKRHDFRVFKESGGYLLQNTMLLADTGYKGMQSIHSNVQLPHKKTGNVILVVFL